jgi:hypothetical protein
MGHLQPSSGSQRPQGHWLLPLRVLCWFLNVTSVRLPLVVGLMSVPADMMQEGS